VKRSTIAALTAALSVAISLPLVGVAAADDPANSANLEVSAGGIKKADATWDDWSLDPLSVAPFDAYLVTADDDNANAGLASDRTKFVAQSDPREVTFDDLTSGTNYYFSVYAIDYTTTGVTIVPPDGTEPGTPVGFVLGEGSDLTINTSPAVILTGNAATISGVLSGDGGRAGETVSLEADEFPFSGNDWVEVGVATAGGGGAWSRSVSPTINTRYRAFYSDPDGVGAWTRNVAVEVKKKIQISVAPNTTVSAGTQLRYSGTLPGDPSFYQPPLAGEEIVRVCLRRAGSTQSIKCSAVNAQGEYLIKHTPGVDQDGKYRVTSGMGPAYADSVSRNLRIRVN